jgi:hypothetical protein
VVLCTLGLLRESLRSGGMPERMTAATIGFYTLGCLGWVVSAAGSASLPPPIRFQISAISELFLAAGSLLFFLGTWRFFRADSRWAGGVTIGGGLAMLVAWVYLVLQGRPIEPSEAHLPTAVLSVSRVLCLVWRGSESLLHYKRLKLRVGFGLATLEDAERFHYLGIGSTSASVAMGSALLCGWALGQPPREVPIVFAFIVAIGVLAAAMVFRALLLPPTRHEAGEAPETS